MNRVPGRGVRFEDAAEMLWVVLANVSGGDWTKQSKAWQKYAARWRDYYFKAITTKRKENENKPRSTIKSIKRK